MSVIGSNILAGASGQGGAYNLTNSLRFRSSASAYLNRTFATGNRRTFTWSGWLKRGSLTGNQALMSPYTNGTGSGTYGVFRFVDGSIEFLDYTNGTYNAYFYTSSSQYTFRDPSAWYHIVLAVDTTQATGSDRIKIYVNGTQITGTFYATPTLNYDLQWNNNLVNYIGYTPSGSQYFDGYLAEVNFIDGQALTPSSFGQTSATTGVWIPKKFSGTYGTNGFYLPFTDNSALTTSSNVGLGKDFSGNSNYWTTNGISITSGSTYDSMTDVPTLTSATAANYATINALDYNSTYLTLNDGNLHQTYAGVVAAAASRATMVIPTTGKYYWEVYINATGGGAGERIRVGITRPTTAISGNSIDGSATSYLQMSNGQKRNNSTDSTYGSGFSATQIIQVLYDATAGAIYFGQNDSYANGTGSFNQTFSTATAAFTGLLGEFMPCFVTYGGADIAVNFGQRPFAYTPPTGFVALNTFNLPTPTIGATASTTANKYMDATLYTGAGNTSTSITNAGGFQPDFVWTKARSIGYSNYLYDSVRGTGTTKSLVSNGTGAEGDDATNANLSSFNSNGWTIGTTSGTNALNASGQTFVAWQWRASNATAVTNTAGTITSTVSASTTAGFSIVTYSANGSTGTVGHGLGVTPSMIIVKKRNVAERWCVFHTSTSNAYIYLNEVFAAETSNANTRFGNNTVVVQPTDSVFTIGSSNDVNGTSGTYVAYCFAQVAGYSAFGSYVGNGVADGPFIYTGFRPRYYILKNITNSQSWSVQDTSRSPYNVGSAVLLPNSSSAELTGTDFVDILSNGFKIRHSSSGNNNNSGDTYIYMAFAESPFRYANAR